MEKIIAVVVMIAIVVGLIATAVMPTVNQMEAQGDSAMQDLAMLTAGLQDGQVLGSTIIADYQIQSKTGKCTSFKIDDNQCVTTSGTTTSWASIATVEGYVEDKAVYTKEVTYDNAGNVATVLYKIQ